MGKKINPKGVSMFYPYFLSLLGLMLFFNSALFAKIRFLTFHYNKPEYIELQYKTFNKFLLDDYELIVFNDAKNPELVKAINTTCRNLGIMCVRYEQLWHERNPLNDQVLKWISDPTINSHLNFSEIKIESIRSQPSIRHCHVIQYALENYGYNHDDIVGILDGDCFLSRPLSIKDLLGDNHIAGIQKYFVEEEIDYLWVPFIIFNPQKIENKDDLKFHVDIINGRLHDTGAHTYHFLKNNPAIRCQKYQGNNSSGFYHWTDQQISSSGFSEREIKFIRDLEAIKGFPWPITVEFHVQNHFIHLGNSSFDLPGHQDKEKCIYDFLIEENKE
jgi:hypothetical protein